MGTVTTTFIRLLSAQDKGEALAEAVASCREGKPKAGTLFTVDPAAFSKVPNSPFAYWVDDSIRELFAKLPPFEGEGRAARQGLATADDFRFVRAWWEVPAEHRLDAANGPDWRRDLAAFQGWCRERTRHCKCWVPFAKGGEYSPYYVDIHLVVNWKGDGEEVRSFIDPVTGKSHSRPQSTEYYYRPGITWPERTTSGYAPQVLPAGAAFSHMGNQMTLPDHRDLLWLLAAHNTRAFQYLLEILIGLGDSSVSGSAARHYANGALAKLPYPERLLDAAAKRELASSSHVLTHWRRSSFERDVSSLVFRSPWVNGAYTPASADKALTDASRGAVAAGAAAAAAEVCVRSALSMSASTIEAVRLSVGPNTWVDLPLEDSPLVDQMLSRLRADSVDAIVDQAVVEGFADRSITKKSYFVTRIDELIAHRCGVNVEVVVQSRRRLGIVEPALRTDACRECLEWVYGHVWGRWDMRFAQDEDLLSRLPDPFSPLPVCPPATLLSPDGLPATSGNIVSEEWLAARPDAATLPPAGSVEQPTISDSEYPIEVPWNGILVDDPEHPHDIVARMRNVLAVVWKDRAYSVEQEACQALGVGDLRQYMRSPSGFFQDHLSRYSKSRRKAPIYWPLSTRSCSYTLWLYYPRLMENTLYECVTSYVAPRIAAVHAELEALRPKLEGKASADDRRRFEELGELEAELEELREELERVARLGYKPDLDDGVVICACPLYGLFRLTKWQKELREHWVCLEKGEYDWAHLALALWPDRVRQACRTDKSIAIAHGLEKLYEEPAQAEPRKKSPRGRKKQ